LQRHGYHLVILSRHGKFACPELISDVTDLEYGDIRHEATLERVLKRCDVLVHYCGLLGIGESNGDPESFNSVNIGGAESVITVLKRGRHSIGKVVLASSASVYGEGQYRCQSCGLVQPQSRSPGTKPQSEHGNEFSPSCPSCLGAIETVATCESAQRLGLSAYALTKKAQEDIFWDGCASLSLPIAVFRYGTVFGEGQSLVRPYSKILMQLVENEAPIIHEDGKQSRDFINAADAVASTLLWLEESNSSGIFNVGSGVRTSVINFVMKLSNAVFELTGARPPSPIIDWRLMPGEVRHLSLNCQKLEDMGFRAEIGLEEGVEHLVKWFLLKQRTLAQGNSCLTAID